MSDGFTCTCGNVAEYPPYVYAHWDMRLEYTCEKCKAKWAIIKGHARRISAPKLARRPAS